ncbi:MAG TPA: dialkylresorcinol condensing enzyme [bacterium]
MRKRVLVLHYSQTGQLTSAIRSMIGPLERDPEIEVTWEELKPVRPYPFPWPLLQFFDVFPESVFLDPPAMQPVAFDPDSRFDLVVIAYQVWFLSPSLPVTGFLKSEAARVLDGAPVVTVIVCRNMWLTAQEKMRALIEARGGRLVDNVALVDRGSPWTTFVTTPRWLLTGRKGPFWGIFPGAGVSRQDIEGAARFGRALADGLRKTGDGPVRESMLAGLGAVRVNPAYIMSERMGQRSFRAWGRLLRALGPPAAPLRRVALVVYVVFLVCLILTVVPLGIVVRAVLRPFLRRRLDAEVARLEGPSGSSTERVQSFGSA